MGKMRYFLRFEEKFNDILRLFFVLHKITVIHIILNYGEF